MRIIVCENYEEVSKKAAQMILSQVTLKPNSVLGLATGSTPIGMYENLVSLNKKGDIDFADRIAEDFSIPPLVYGGL